MGSYLPDRVLTNLYTLLHLMLKASEREVIIRSLFFAGEVKGLIWLNNWPRVCIDGKNYDFNTNMLISNSTLFSSHQIIAGPFSAMPFSFLKTSHSHYFPCRRAKDTMNLFGTSVDKQTVTQSTKTHKHVLFKKIFPPERSSRLGKNRTES